MLRSGASPLKAIYDPSVFDVGSFRQSQGIILTAEGVGVDKRWRLETPWIAELAIRTLRITNESWVLDYGCGVGRIAKALIEDAGCYVIGMDISPNMKTLANRYVDSERFYTVSADGRPLVMDSAVAVWALQHCANPVYDITLIRKTLPVGGRFLVVNNFQRAVPVVNDRKRAWLDDGVNLWSIFMESFRLLERGMLPEEFAPEPRGSTYWALFEAI